jgi:glutamate formiminotransferase
LIVECVPNFSEGRDSAIVGKIAGAIDEVHGAILLDSTSDPDHNRSVLTFAGSPSSVAEAALAAIHVAAEAIDLNRHAGVHPRVGAADVVPFVPVQGIGMDECATLARDAGCRIWNELRIPVFLYEFAAIRPECRRLENVRRLARAGEAPDIGKGRHPTAGACVVGARRFLIAWNINLRTTDLEAARQIAREIRASNGGLADVKALGLPLASRGEVQVSINLVDFETTPLHVIFEAVAERCQERRIEIAGSELIGMIPRAALRASEGHELRWLNLSSERVLENRLAVDPSNVDPAN